MNFKVGDIVEHKNLKEDGKIIKIDFLYRFIWRDLVSELWPWKKYYLITVQFVDSRRIISSPEDLEFIGRLDIVTTLNIYYYTKSFFHEDFELS